LKPCGDTAMILGPRDRPATGYRLGWDSVRTDQVIYCGRVRAALFTRRWLLRAYRAIRVAAVLSESDGVFGPSICVGSLRLRDAAPDVYVASIVSIAPIRVTAQMVRRAA